VYLIRGNSGGCLLGGLIESRPTGGLGPEITPGLLWLNHQSVRVRRGDPDVRCEYRLCVLGGDRDHGRVGGRDGVVGGTPLSGETDVFGADRDGGGRLRTPPTAAVASRRNHPGRRSFPP